MPPRHIALVLAICVAWGANFLALAWAVREFPPFFATALRLAIVLLCLLPIIRPLPRGQRALATLVAMVGAGIHLGLILTALRVAGDISSVAIALQCFVPISALLAIPLLGERPDRRTAFGIGLAFAGVLVLGLDPLALDAPVALGLTLGSAFALGLSTTLTRRLRGVPAMQLQAWAAALSVPGLLATSALLEQGQIAALLSATWQAWAGVAYSAIASSVFGHAMVMWLVQRHPVARVTPWLQLSPVFSVAIAILVWGDRPGAELAAGGAMVLGGVLLVTVRPTPAAAESV